MVKIEVLNIKEVKEFLESKNEKVLSEAEKAIAMATLYVEGEVKSSIAGQRAEPRSVDTGQLLNSVTSNSNGLQGTVSSDVEQALYMEYGTVYIPERRHFRNTLARNQEKINDYIKAACEKATK